MAQKTIVTLIDDLDGTPIEEGTGETIKFSFDNVSYSIDLNDRNASQFRELVGPYVKNAQTSGRSTATRSSAGRNSKEDLAAARTWLRDNGHKVSDRGRIPTELMELFKASK